MTQNSQKSQEFKKVGECLYRNGNGVYFALIKVRGKQIKRSLKTTDAAIAKRSLAELRGKTERLLGKENRNVRFDEFSAAWLASIKATLKEQSHRRRSVAVNGLKPHFKHLMVREINFTHIDDWQKKRGGTKSARTHNIELETLNQLLEYGWKRGIVMDNHAKAFKRRKQSHAVIQTPSREQFAVLIQCLRESSQSQESGATDMVEFLAFSGMRVGEAREVLVPDINLALGSVLITGGENGTKNHRQRTIPLFPNLRVVCERIIGKVGKSTESAPLFTIQSPRGALTLACKKTGLPRFTVHSLRHFFATQAIESGIDFKTIADWLGHSDDGILVGKTYGHLREVHSAAMAKKMTFQVA